MEHGKRRRAIGHQYVDHAPAVHQLRGIPDKFIPHQRLVVREREADIPAGFALLRDFRQTFRGRFRGVRGKAPVRTPLRDFVILAERALQVAPEAADGKDHTPRMEMHEGLFLYRIQRQG